MQIFETLDQVPVGFDGCCYILEWQSTEWYENGLSHRLGGYARYWYHDGVLYGQWYINGKRILRELEYQNHPLVLQNKIDRIINESLG